ncbi:Fic family protein [Niabella drilacis]|uniref:Fic family protein n=1 Tax=Niabella drilacis (strain DSM 25811 / CCM 8410 / CCUG 62505 / LMG 26954 / E90) TaxID=1285928 RepID=A0A1G7AAH6_NIADE|nr:Fic family protein [Niabella drilacis]SDE11938.1 Fic family protein [Niabella drilacis]
MNRELPEAEQTALSQTILQINNSYLDWEKVQHMTLMPDSFSNTAIWEAARQARVQGFTRNLVIFDQSFTWSVSNDMEAALHDLDVHLAGGRNISAVMDQKNDHRYLVTAALDEAMASAQLAGYPATRKMVRELLLKKKTTANETEQVVVNLYKCLQKVSEWGQEPFSEAMLLELHQLLTKDTIKLKGIGRYRTNNKYDASGIGSAASYKAVDAKSIGAWMQWLEAFINEDKKPFFIHPVIKACIIAYLVTYIRPFRDGNGRMARLLMYAYLLRQGYWVTKYTAVSNILIKLKAPYQKSFLQATANADTGYFIHFMIQALRMADRSLKESLQRTNKEKESNPFIKIDGLNVRQATALQWISDDPEKIVTIRELRSGFGVSKETARTDLTALAENGWLKFYHLNKKTYAFIKGDGFDKLLKEKLNL